MTVLNAEKLNLREVQQLLGLQPEPLGNYRTRLNLESLSEYEQQELAQIAADFDRYLAADKVSEGLVKALTTYPLLRLAGFYRYPVELQIEEGIARIAIPESDQVITGRFDILAINPTATPDEQPFWVLIVEAKNSAIDVSAGLAQLLVYAFKSLEHQDTVWGLVTNGINYQFVYLRQGTPAAYQPFPPLHLFERDRALQLLQALKAIRQLQRPDQATSAVA